MAVYSYSHLQPEKPKHLNLGQYLPSITMAALDAGRLSKFMIRGMPKKQLATP